MASYRSPSEYLSKLRQEHRERLTDNPDLRALRAVLPDISDATDESLSKTLDRDYGQLLLKRLSPRLKGRFDELFAEDFLAVGESKDPSPNAYTVPLGDLHFAVVFNSGLREFIYRVTRALATRINVEGDTPEHEPLSFEETCHIVGDIFLWFRETGEACGPSYSVSRWQLLFANELATEAELFFLAHEFGHVMCSFAHYSETKGEGICNTADLEEEFQADSFALHVLLQPAGDAYPMAQQPICYAGAELALLIYAGLEFLGIEFQATHPPAMERLERLRTTIREASTNSGWISSLTSLSACVDAVFTGVLKFLESDSYELFLGRAAASTLKRLDDALESCTGGVVPDYCSFAVHASDLFSGGYTKKLYDRMTQVASEFARRLKTLKNSSPEASDQEKAEAWVAFQKYKLLMHSVMFMNEPAKSIFEDALRTDE